MPMETLSEAMNRLRADGYTESFRVEKGKLVASEADRAFEPDEVKVDEIQRFEGDSNPSDMAILFAIRVPETDIRGVWSSSYGARMSPGSTKVARELETDR